ncbi:MAG: hypothetical protein SGPRY_002243, partial [Prymnesium sp.]
MLSRISFDGGGAPPSLTTRFVSSEAFTHAKKGQMGFAEFMTPVAAPGTGAAGLLRNLRGVLTFKTTDNACVNLIQHAGQVLAMTETHRSWTRIDPSTLETCGRVQWAGDRVGILGTAHPWADPAGGGLLNVATDIFPFFSSYQVYKLPKEAPWRREVIASIPCVDRASPRWVHSFGATRNTVVVIEQPAAYDLGSMFGLWQASHFNLEWLADQGTHVHVLDRHSGEVNTRVMKTAFFFHVCNAFDYEDDKGGGVCVDLCVFDDCKILHSLSLDCLNSEGPLQDLPRSRINRLRLPRLGSELPTLTALDNEQLSGGYAELPTINPLMNGNGSYKYVYTIGASRPAAVANAVVKSDVSGAGGDAFFKLDGMLPGEPLFVPHPDASAEDDGVVLTLGTDSDG